MSTTPTPEEIIAHLRAELAEAHALNDKLAPLQAIIECAGSDALNQAVSAIRETQAQLRSAERTIMVQRDDIFALRKELESSRAEVRRLTEDRAVRACECSPEDACAHVRRAEAAEREVQRLTEEARRSGAGRVEAPEMAVSDLELDWLDPESIDYPRTVANINAWFRSRLSPSPQPATGAAVKIPEPTGISFFDDGRDFEQRRRDVLQGIQWARLNARIVYPATCKDSLQVPQPQPSADVVVVPTDLVDEIVGRHEAAKSLLANEPDDLGTEDADPMEVTQWSNELGYQKDKLNEALDRLSALRSSTNHDAQDAGEGR